MSPEEKAQAWAFALLHKTNRMQAEILKRSVPVPLTLPKTPEITKPGVRREAPTPRGQGTRKRFAVS